MIKLDTVKIDLPFKRKFTISKGEASSKTNFLTIMNNRYIGEASGSIYYGPSSDEIENDLKTGIEQFLIIKLNQSPKNMETVTGLQGEQTEAEDYLLLFNIKAVM